MDDEEGMRNEKARRKHQSIFKRVRNFLGEAEKHVWKIGVPHNVCE
jgi:hypothetical protein